MTWRFPVDLNSIPRSVYLLKDLVMLALMLSMVTFYFSTSNAQSQAYEQMVKYDPPVKGLVLDAVACIENQSGYPHLFCDPRQTNVTSVVPGNFNFSIGAGG